MNIVCFCGDKLVLMNDHTIEEMGGYDEGIVHLMECKNKECSICEVLFYRRWKNVE